MYEATTRYIHTYSRTSLLLTFCTGTSSRQTWSSTSCSTPRSVTSGCLGPSPLARLALPLPLTLGMRLRALEAVHTQQGAPGRPVVPARERRAGERRPQRHEQVIAPPCAAYALLVRARPCEGASALAALVTRASLLARSATSSSAASSANGSANGSALHSANSTYAVGTLRYMGPVI